MDSLRGAGELPADTYLAARVERVAGRAGKKLASAGLATVGDLLRHFPRRYEDPRIPTDMALLRLDEMATINARIASVVTRPTKNRSQWLVAAVITDGTHQLNLTFFLRKYHLVEYYERELQVGRMGLFTGRVGHYRGTLQLVHPEVMWEEQSAGLDPRFANRLIPIYPAVAGLASPALRRAIQAALTALDDDVPTDPLPPNVLSSCGLPSLGQALWDIHNPARPAEWARARHRFRFEEAFELQAALAQRRWRARRSGGAVPRPPRQDGLSLVSALDARLPFELTSAQRAAGERLSRLVSEVAPMNQLLQGDVGSGKTVVALRAMLQVIESGGQAALLAPTEVLAAQHYRTIRELLGPLVEEDALFLEVDDLAREAGPGAGGAEGVAGAAGVAGRAGSGGGAARGAGPGAAGRVRLRCLTGSLTPKAKAQAHADLRAGRIDLVIGTHALLEEAVSFKDLGLVVVDEQHRFGVEQRDALRSKGESVPHVLVMTATPIPRTVAMTVFGDLGLITLETSPPGRQPVATTWVNPKTHPAWLTRVWERIAEEVAAGHRAFVICPAIEPGQVEAGTQIVEDPGELLGQLAFPGLSNPPQLTERAPPPDASASHTMWPKPLHLNPVSPTRGPRKISEGSGESLWGGSRGEVTSGSGLASVSQVLADLAAVPALQGVRLAPLHGRMSAAEKEQTMAAFVAGDIDVLVATTVVEVGIDVREATGLVVLDADRFGLSQLHQLRGRVGRGADPAVCLLVSDAAPDSTAAVRLEAMQRTTDGFELAEVDLATRREGQILGDTQSGSSSLKLVRLAQDAELIADAREAAQRLVEQDPELVTQPALAASIGRLLAGREAYLERG
ncbi:MAG: ATP-dependent DNA helicase RecG [Bifidobacteriaceae bacterium]|jgi:ATP-dependent DNA helicase RecG|nr:ATP-dependent DNA helicase RecG [Bifidobacteriaceae bacterium]